MGQVMDILRSKKGQYFADQKKYFYNQTFEGIWLNTKKKTKRIDFKNIFYE